MVGWGQHWLCPETDLGLVPTLASDQLGFLGKFLTSLSLSFLSMECGSEGSFPTVER